MTCRNCLHHTTYHEINTKMELTGYTSHVCMLTDAEVKLTDNCIDFKRRPRQSWESIEEWEKLQ